MDYDKLYSGMPNVPKTPKEALPVTLPELPDTEEVRELARFVMPQAFKVLLAMMLSDDTPPAIRQRCAETIIDRGYGKAAQSIEHTGKVQFEQLIVECYPPTIEGKVIEVETTQAPERSLSLESK